MPDITFLLDVDVEIAFERLKEMDRMESQGIEFHKRVREGFLKLAKDNPDRFVVIDATKPISDIFDSIRNVLWERFNIR